MAKPTRDLRRIERSVQNLTGSRRQASGLGKKIETRLKQVAASHARAANRNPQLAAVNEAQLIKKLVQSGQAGWVNDPDLKKVVLVERGAGCVLTDAKNKVIAAPKLLLPSKPAINKGVFIQHLKTPGIELFVPSTYVDTKSNVTVGVGHLITNADAAKSLTFVEMQSGKPADKDQVVAAFNRVKASPLKPGDWLDVSFQ